VASPTLAESSERLLSSLGSLGIKILAVPGTLARSDKVTRELRQARAVGQLTVLATAAKVRSKFAAPPAPVRAENPEPESAGTTAPPACIPDYANLSAAQIVPLLSALTDVERAEVAAYEGATRKRKTILAALSSPTA
jgi:hypothetical protein